MKSIKKSVKQSILGILMLLLAFSVGATNTPKETYTIQVGSFSEPQAAHFQLLKNVGIVYLENVANSALKRVLVGKFETRAAAEVYLAKVKNVGYDAAFIVSRKAEGVHMVKVIQLASYRVGSRVDLAAAKQLGALYMHIKDDEVRLLTGFFSDITAAKAVLDKARAVGFASAFMKDTEKIWVEKVGDFEAEFLALGEYEAAVSTPTVPKIPTLNATATVKTEPTATTKTPTVAKSSVAGLQEVLKENRQYDGVVDGVYDADTKAGLENFQKNDEVYLRYAERAKDEPQFYTAKGDVYSLQGNVDLIEFNPNTAAQNLGTFEHPIAKVYKAYLYQAGLVKTDDVRTAVNGLMNAAIEETFRNFEGRTHFDFSKKYDYLDLKMLLQHFAYLYEVRDDNPKIPCWMIENHNYELSQAFAGLKAPTFTACEGFESIKEVRILQAMAQDMDLLSEKERLESSRAERQAYTARRTELYLKPTKISLPEQELYEMWQNNLLRAVKKNLEKDPLRKDILTAFQVTYFSVSERLENHYKMKGFEETQAKALALATLYALVNYHLGDYITF